MGNRNQIKISYIVVFTIILSSIVYYFNSFEEKVAVCGTPDTIIIDGKVLSENDKQGRRLFKVFCASCHRIDNLRSHPILKNLQIDSITFYKHLTKKDTPNVKHHKPHFFQLSFQDTNDIFGYLKVKNIILQK